MAIGYQPDILPDSRLTQPKNVQRVVNKLGSLNWVPIFCANCGKDGGLVPEENMDFCCYLCDPCAEKLAPVLGDYIVPDQVFYAKVKAAQIEKYGRELAPPEVIQALQDKNSVLSRLSKEHKGR